MTDPASRQGASAATGAPEDSSVTQDYLKAVWSSTEWGGPGASVTGLARRMGVAPSTASENVARLVEAGLLEHETYRTVSLSPEGRRRAMAMVRRHRLLETYLVSALGFEWDEVHAEAEVLEHAVSDRLLDRLDAALGRPVRDPHGDPIPRADGILVEPSLRPVEALATGESGVVARILDDPAILRDLAAAGIGLDVRVTLEYRTTVLPAEGGGIRRPTVVLSGPDGRTQVPHGCLWLLA